jgi:hypothetical protein
LLQLIYQFKPATFYWRACTMSVSGHVC